MTQGLVSLARPVLSSWHMTKTLRTDPHRPGSIIPADYTFELSFWYGTAECPEGYGLEDLACVVDQYPRFRDVDGRCDVCGARFAYGGAFVHRPTGQTILVGGDCAAKYSMLIDFARFDAVKEMGKRATAAALTRRRNQQRREIFLGSNPGLREALACGHRITNDLADKLTQYHSLSSAQIALAFKLHAETFAPVRAAEVNIPAPIGRTAIRGTVVSIKEHRTDFGDTWKMTVKVVTDAGTWLCWSTVPATIMDANRTAGRDAYGLKGCEVEFTATLQPGREKHFAFAKRPTGGAIVTAAAPAVANAGALRELAKVEGQVDPAVYAAAKAALEGREVEPRPGMAGNVVAKFNAEMGIATRGYGS
jgi:hypothetical protein